MLRVSVDLVPFGFENRKKNLYTIEIINIGGEGVTVGEDGEPRCSYRISVVDKYGGRTDHGVLIKGFDRQQPASVLVNLVCHTLGIMG